MKTKFLRFAALLLLYYTLPQSAFAADTLIPVGQVVGLELQNNTVTVAAFAENSRARQAGVEVGDRILRVNDREILCTQDIRRALDCSQGTVELMLTRDGEELTLTVAPEAAAGGPKLGIYLRQGVTGIGTVTYYDPKTGEFGTLGHGVADTTGTLLKLCSGSAYAARVTSVRKGVSGEPGQLMGALETGDALGSLYRNTSQGVFGKTRLAFQGKAMAVGSWREVKTGHAVILSTVEGSAPQEYSVEILKIYPAERKNGRNLLLKITDPTLLEATGGIVQGMSGSPIIQDGKLVGAVTHVLVNDPTTGYGIFIENMLDAAA